jgi:hypothetical protein
MHGLYVEERALNGRDSLSWDLARHMYARSIHGKVAVVTDRPRELLSSTRKQWFKMLRRAQREQSSTLDARRILELTRQIAHMYCLKFTARPPEDLLEANVTFATADDFVKIPPMCPTVYITYSFEREKLYMLTSWLPKNSVVVIYA